MMRRTRPSRLLPAAVWRLLALVAVLVPAGAGAQVTVRGEVREPDARPIGLAEVLVNDSLHARTDSAGRFLLTGLPAGTIELTVRRVGFAPLSIPLTSEAGQRRALAIELTPLAYRLDPVVVSVARPGLFGQVVAEGGAPLAGAEVLVAGGGDPVTTGADGGFALPGLRARTYLVRVRRDGHHAARFSVTLPADRGQEVRVELEALGDELHGGARRLASGHSPVEARRLLDLDRRVRVNNPLIVSRDVLERAGKRGVADVLAHDQLTALPARPSGDIGSPVQPAGGGEGASSGGDARVARAAGRVDGGICYFVDGDYALDQYAAKTMPAAWIESVEISRRDDTDTLVRRLPPETDRTMCRGFVVIWTRR